MGAVVLTKRPLGASVPYPQDKQDRFHDTDPVGGVRGHIYSDQAGTLYLEESDDDGATWSTTSTVAVSASVTAKLDWTAMSKRWYRFRYVNGATAQTKFVLIQQTRGMELDDVQLSGRKLAVVSAAYDELLNVAAAGTVTVTITPPAGELWRIKDLYISAPAPSGAASGTHALLIYPYGNDLKYTVLTLDSTFGNAVTIARNYAFVATSASVPNDLNAQMRAILNIVVTNSCPLRIHYANNTNVLQSGTLSINVAREVEYIVS